MLRAVIFDLDDTLFDDHHSMLSGLEALRFAHPELSERSPHQLLDDYLAAMLTLEPDFLAGRLSLHDFRLRRFESLYAQWNVENVSGEEGFRTFRGGYQAARRIVEGTVELLEALRERGLKVGVPPKPHAQAYLGCLAALDVSATQAVMIGDSWANDVIGPRGVGLRSIWFERRGRAAPESGMPVLRSYTPLIEALNVILDVSGHLITMQRL